MRLKGTSYFIANFPLPPCYVTKLTLLRYVRYYNNPTIWQPLYLIIVQLAHMTTITLYNLYIYITVARFVKMKNGHLTVKFDEIGVLSFGQKIPSVLSGCGSKYYTIDVLSTFSLGFTDDFKIYYVLHQL